MTATMDHQHAAGARHQQRPTRQAPPPAQDTAELDIQDLIIDDIDIRSAIDSCARSTTIHDLGLQGYTTVKVLDASKIAALIRQAVNEAIAGRTATFIDKERTRIEMESQERLNQLLAQQAQTTTVASLGEMSGDVPQPRGEYPDLDELTQKVTEAVRAELTGSGAGQQLEAIEQKMHKLISMLEMVERVAGRISAAPRRAGSTTQAYAPVIDDLRSSLLQEIFKHNLELRNIK